MVEAYLEILPCNNGSCEPILRYLNGFKDHNSSRIKEAYITDWNNVFARIECEDHAKLRVFMCMLKVFGYAKSVYGLIVL